MAVDYATHYAEVETQLRDLLVKFGDRLTMKDRDEATDYLEAGEYGLALETIAEGLREQDGRVDPHIVVTFIAPLAKAMQMEDRPFLKLR